MEKKIPMEKDYLQASKFVLYPRLPLLDFGAVGQGEKVAPKTFTIDSVAEIDGTIHCDADWVVILPGTFAKGQSEISVRLVTEKLRKGEEYKAQLVVTLSPNAAEFAKMRELSDEKEIVEVRVVVRRYNDEDIAAMETRLTILEQQFAAIRRDNQQLKEQLHQLQQSNTPVIIDQLEKQIHATLERVSERDTDEETANHILPAAKYLAESKNETISRRTILVAQDDSGDFKTLFSALRSAEGGEEILVKAGTYHENNIYLKSGITLKGEGADKTIIISKGQAFLISKVNNVQVGGFRVQGRFTGYYITESQNVTIERNIVINCGTYGIANYGDCKNLSVRNNIITNNLVGIRMNRDSGFIIKNNIILNNSKGIDGYNATWQEIAYNNFYNNNVNCVGCSKNETDISIDPMFVAPEEGDFRLKPSSPCRNAGENRTAIGAAIG